jgi:microcystin degradation protein MlrC
MTYRIAVARIQQETNALSRVLTTDEDFRRTHFYEGDDLLHRIGPDGQEVEGFLKNAELSGFMRALTKHGGVDVVPLFSAWAISAGPVSIQTYAGYSDRLVADIKAAWPLDALCLAQHGSMNVENDPDPEGTLLARLKAEFPDLRIATTLDLHGMITPAMVAGADVLCGYRTNPHRDHAAIGTKAGRILLGLLDGDVRPTTAWRTLPLVLGGGITIDFLPPVFHLFRWMSRKERDPRVLSISLFMVHPYNAHPRLGWSVHIVTDGNQSLAEALADELADLAWAVRHKQPPTFPSAAEAIDRTHRARLRRMVGTVVMSDASDVVGAGASGENTRLLDALLTDGRGLISFLPLRDPEVVDDLWGRRVGETVHASVGGKLDPHWNDPLDVHGKILSQTGTEAFGRIVVLDLGYVKLCLTEAAPLVMQPSFYKNLGLSLWDADVAVCKSFFPFLLYFAPYARKNIFVKTRGATDFDAISTLTFQDPVWPLQDVDGWREIDGLRRGA